MVDIQIDDAGIFTLSLADISGSKTIQNSLLHSTSNISNSTSDTRVVLKLPLSVQQWTSYMTFVNEGVPSLNALKVIDYLDDDDQFTKWYVAMCMRDKSFEDITNCTSQTSFVMSNIKPYLGMKTLNKLIMCLRQYVKTDAKNAICWILPLVPDYNKLYAAHKQCQNYRDTFNIPLPLRKILFGYWMLLASENCGLDYDLQSISAGLNDPQYHTNVKFTSRFTEVYVKLDNHTSTKYKVINVNNYISKEFISCRLVLGIDPVNTHLFTFSF